MKVSKQIYYVEGTKYVKKIIYGVLLESDTSLMHEAAERLADPFLGIEIVGNFISKPGLSAIHVSKKKVTELYESTKKWPNI